VSLVNDGHLFMADLSFVSFPTLAIFKTVNLMVLLCGKGEGRFVYKAMEERVREEDRAHGPLCETS
jgi:hypothetical protein